MTARLLFRAWACIPLTLALQAVKETDLHDASALFLFVVTVVLWTIGDYMDGKS